MDRQETLEGTSVTDKYLKEQRRVPKRAPSLIETADFVDIKNITNKGQRKLDIPGHECL